MKRSRRRCVLAGALLSLITPSLGKADSSYKVGPEDVLKIRVARHEEMGTEAVILQDGRVMLPVIGQLSVNGLTVEAIRDLVVQGLRKRLVHPDVSVDVVRPRPQRIFVSGAVKGSQWMDWKQGWRVTEALASAGGLTVRPEVAHGTLFRLPNTNLKLNLAGIYIDQDPGANLALQPGDVIDIQEPPTVRIYVSGQVQRTGVYDLTRGGGAVEALSLAGGQSSNAALSRAYVQKSDGQKIPVDLARLINHNGPTRTLAAAPSGVPAEGQPAASADPSLEAGDQLVVPENVTKIAVFGQVIHSGIFPLRDGEETTVADAVSISGGFDKRAQKSQIGIIRMVDGKQTVVVVDMNRLVKGKIENPVLQDRDIVFVPESRKPDWAGKILPAVQAMAGAVFYLR
jgi:polysaccharide export outer membrane protein